MDEFGKGFIDILKSLAWMTGVLVRQFDLGRDGYLPEYASKEGRDAIRQIEEAAKLKKNESKQKQFPMGFA